MRLSASGATRLPFAASPKQVAWLEAYRTRREQEEPGLRVTRQMLIALAVERGLEQLAPDLEPT